MEIIYFDQAIFKSRIRSIAFCNRVLLVTVVRGQFWQCWFWKHTRFWKVVTHCFRIDKQNMEVISSDSVISFQDLHFITPVQNSRHIIRMSVIQLEKKLQVQLCLVVQPWNYYSKLHAQFISARRQSQHHGQLPDSRLMPSASWAGLYQRIWSYINPAPVRESLDSLPFAWQGFLLRFLISGERAPKIKPQRNGTPRNSCRSTEHEQRSAPQREKRDSWSECIGTKLFPPGVEKWLAYLCFSYDAMTTPKYSFPLAVRKKRL